MTDRPIIFNAAMIRAILEGRKTVTRRVIKPQPIEWMVGSGCNAFCGEDEKWRLCPYGKIGQRLWVRETQAKNYPAVYMADVSPGFYPSYLWRPSIHMPREASRITLEVTGVRVERVQDITEADAEAEGFPIPEDKRKCYADRDDTARAWFKELWNDINAARGFGWDANPFVWVVEFRRVQP